MLAPCAIASFISKLFAFFRPCSSTHASFAITAVAGTCLCAQCAIIWHSACMNNHKASILLECSRFCFYLSMLGLYKLMIYIFIIGLKFKNRHFCVLLNGFWSYDFQDCVWMHCVSKENSWDDEK